MILLNLTFGRILDIVVFFKRVLMLYNGNNFNYISITNAFKQYFMLMPSDLGNKFSLN